MDTLGQQTEEEKPASRKCIHVAAAIIVRGEGASREILATQRGYGEFKDWWEFPGGKVQPGEAAFDACARELREELAVALADVVPFMTVDYDYPDFHLTMDCFTCRLAPGEQISLLEHEAMRWLGRDKLDDVRWLPADEGIIEALRTMLV